MAILTSVRSYLIVVLICISPIISDVEHFFFQVPVGYLHVFGEMSVQVFAHFSIGLLVFLLLSCMSCLYILEIKPLSIASLANIFSYSVGFLNFFDGLLCCSKLLSLIKSCQFVFLLSSRMWIKQNVAMLNVICSTYIFPQELYSIQPYIQVFNPF